MLNNAVKSNSPLTLLYLLLTCHLPVTQCFPTGMRTQICEAKQQVTLSFILQYPEANQVTSIQMSITPFNHHCSDNTLI